MSNEPTLAAEQDLRVERSGTDADASPQVPSSADYVESDTALTVTDEAMGRDRWLAVLREVGPERTSTWHLGDLLAFGERRYGDGTYQLAAEVLGYRNVGSLRNMASVSRQVAPEDRQPSLSWRAHRVVAKLDHESQRDWLGVAAEHAWTSEELAAAIRKSTSEERDWPDPEGDDEVCSRCGGSGLEPETP